jgi:ferredoxin
MTYIINDKCEGCGDCVDECPVESITEKDGTYTIDADSCVDCGTCTEVCPVDAPVPEDEA